MIMTDSDPFLEHYSNISTTPGVGYKNGNNVKVFNKTIATTTTTTATNDTDNDNDDYSVLSSSNTIRNLGTISRPSVSGLTCTGDLDYPAAKSLATLFPVVSSKHQQQNRQKAHPCLDDSANRIYLKEVLSDAACTKMSNNNGTTSTGSSFDMDSLKILIEKEEKKNKKKEKVGNTNRNVNSDESNNVSVVQFSNVTIQEYPIQPGDNPGGNTGCPLTIGWDPIGEPVTVQIDLYEKFRFGTSSNGSGDNDNDYNDNNNRRSNKKLCPLVSAHREHILHQLGYTSKSIRAGTKSANQTRRNRYQTIARLKSSKSDEFLESIQKNLHNIITCGEKKRREKKFLAPYLSTSSSSNSNNNNNNNNKFSNKDESHTSVIFFNDDSVGTNCSIKNNSSL
jgi:hypothetical protein